MRKSLFLGILALVCASCQKVDVSSYLEEENATERTDVQFVIKNLSVEYATRATIQSEGMTDLYVWEGATLLAHQQSTDANFGSPTISLTIGAHDLTFVASKAEGQTWSEGVWSCTKMKDTFATVLEYTVSQSSTSKQVSLSRRVGKVMWTIEDAIPSGATTLTASIKDQCFGLDASLNGVQPKQYDATFDISSRTGQTGLTVSILALPASAEGSTVTASIAVDDLCSYENEVTVRANEVCDIYGDFFSDTNSALVDLVTDWGETTKYEIR